MLLPKPPKKDTYGLQCLFLWVDPPHLATSKVPLVRWQPLSAVSWALAPLQSLAFSSQLAGSSRSPRHMPNQRPGKLLCYAGSQRRKFVPERNRPLRIFSKIHRFIAADSLSTALPRTKVWYLPEEGGGVPHKLRP